MSDALPDHGKPLGFWRNIAVCAIIFGLCLRLFNLLDPELWADEIFSVTLAESPFVEMLLTALRFDVHPPLYYTLLHLWGLFGSGDLWFLTSSVLLDIAAGLSLWYCIGRLYGASAGLVGLAVFSVFPIEISFAQTLRMYALFALLAIWLWYHLESVVQGRDSRKRLIGIAALSVAATLSHGAGFIVIFALVLQACLRIAMVRGWRAALRLAVAYLPAVVTAVYPVGIGAVREAGVGLETFDLEAIGVHLTIFLMGFEFPFAPWAGYAAMVLLAAVTLTEPRARAVFLQVVLLPMAILLILSVAVQPVFLFRTLGLLSVFVSVALALGIDGAIRTGTARARLALTLLLPALFVVSAVNYSLRDSKQGYREVAATWVERAAPDAVMLTENTSDFWGILRYDGAESGYSALTVQPPVRDGMARLKARLDGTILGRLGFFGQGRFAERNGRRVYVHIDTELAAQKSQRDVWLVTRGATDCATLGRDEADRFDQQGLVLLKCTAK